MKLKGLIAAVALGTLATLPAHGFGYWNNATYASRYRAAKPAATFQIAVVKNVPGANANPWCAPKTCAVHGH